LLDQTNNLPYSVLDPYSAIPSALRDDPHDPVPANVNFSVELEAYPSSTLFIEQGTS
jgi:hypothetical protein